MRPISWSKLWTFLRGACARSGRNFHCEILEPTPGYDPSVWRPPAGVAQLAAPTGSSERHITRHVQCS
jgi:hypothetical protein